MKPYVLLAVVVLLTVAPFADRGVFMDEHLFLKLAQNAQTNPLFPSDTPGIFFGVETPNFAGNTHPPVGEYFLALLFEVFGEFNEVEFRLAYSIFAIAAVISFYILARMFTTEPLMVALLFAVSPAFFVMAPTLMMDIPMIAFLLAGFVFYFRNKLLPAALCFVFAVGVGFTAMIPIACLLIVLLVGRRPLQEVLCVLAAPAALGLWTLAMTIHYGKVPLVETVTYYVQQSSFGNLLAVLSFLGGVSVFPGVVRMRGRPLLAIIAVATTLSLIATLPTVAARVLFGVLSACGLMLLAAFARSTRSLVASTKNSGEAVFILWAPAVLLFFIIVPDFTTARYILLALPAIYLVVFRETSRTQLIPAVAATAVLAAALAYADFTLTDAYRDWTAQTVPALQQQGFRVWNATESGLRFYVERTGAESLSSRDVRPVGTDLVVLHQGDLIPFRYVLAEDLGVVLTVLEEFPLTSDFPIRTYNKGAGAGFHDSDTGLLPFMFSLTTAGQDSNRSGKPFCSEAAPGINRSRTRARLECGRAHPETISGGTCVSDENSIQHPNTI